MDAASNRPGSQEQGIDPMSQQNQQSASGRRETLDSARESVREAAHQVADEARDVVEPVLEPAKDKALQMAEEQKAIGADRVQSLARAINSAADELGQEMPEAASYIRNAAQGLERASSAVREQRMEDLASVVRDFARKDPAAFIGGSILAGFMLSRVLKSSAQAASRDTGQGARQNQSESAQQAQPAQAQSAYDGMDRTGAEMPAQPAGV